MPFVTLIIPVYNVEKYLRSCLESVLAQHLDNIEIVLVDDGSKDASPLICDEYAANFPFVCVIHKQNGGLSSARNAGLREAHGEYVMFMDSDDLWNKDVSVAEMLQQVAVQPNVEMFLFTGYDFYEGNVQLYERPESKNLCGIRTNTVESYYRDLLNNGNLEVSACTKILKRKFLLDNSLFFTEGLLGEDNDWMIRLLRSLNHVSVIPERLYLCRHRKGSITTSIGYANVRDMLSIISSSISYWNDKSASSIFAMEMCFDAYLWFCALALSGYLTEQEKKLLSPDFKATSCVCSYSANRKTKLAKTMCDLLGINLTSKILYVYAKLHANHIGKTVR